MQFLTALTNFSMIRQHIADSLPHELAYMLSIPQTPRHTWDDVEPEFPPRYNPSYPANVRSVFHGVHWRVHCHPSTGGILIKESANIVDLQYLSLSRFVATNRSSNAEEEDKFCGLMRRVGASWWTEELAFLQAQEREFFESFYHNMQDSEFLAAEEARSQKVVTFGWPSDGVGVWILRFDGDDDENMPSDYRVIDFALDMDERIEVMKGFGAAFVEDPSHVEELRDELPRPPPKVDHCLGTSNPDQQNTY